MVNFNLLQNIFCSGIQWLFCLSTLREAGLGVTTRFFLFWTSTTQSTPTSVPTIAPVTVYAVKVEGYSWTNLLHTNWRSFKILQFSDVIEDRQCVNDIFLKKTGVLLYFQRINFISRIFLLSQLFFYYLLTYYLEGCRIY